MAALHHELRTGSYRHGPYHYFEVHDPKTRTVAAASFRDRVVHHAIVRVIEPLFERRFIEDSYACRKGRGTHAAMRRAAGFARRWRFALKCDVSRYFASIDHAVLLAHTARVVGDPRLLALLAQILATHTDGETREWTAPELFDVHVRRCGLPIGNLTGLPSQAAREVERMCAPEKRKKATRSLLRAVAFLDDRVARRQAPCYIPKKV